MKRLLVVGGTGFLGYHIISKAKKKKFTITSLSKKKPKKKRYHKNIEYIYADLGNVKSLKKALSNRKFDYVINSSGYGAHPEFNLEGLELFRSHFFGVINLVDLIINTKIKKFVHIGSSSEYGDISSPFSEKQNCFPKSPYGLAKFSVTKYFENIFEVYNFPVTVLRLFQVYGSKQDQNRIVPQIIKNCLSNKKFNTTKGNQRCDFCHIDDVTNAIFQTLISKKADGEIINIGSGKPISIKIVIKIIKGVIGKGQPVFGGLKYKKNMQMSNYPKITKAKKILNWKPKIKFIDGIKKIINTWE